MFLFHIVFVIFFLKCSVNNILNSFGGCMCIWMVCWAAFDCVWEKIFSVDICIIFYAGKISSWVCFWRLKIKLFTLLPNKQKKKKTEIIIRSITKTFLFINLLNFCLFFFLLRNEKKRNLFICLEVFLFYFSVYDYVYNFIWRIFHFVYSIPYS